MIAVQALEDLVLPNGIKVRAGQVFFVPDHLGAELIQGGKAKLRQPPGSSREIKSGDPVFGSVPPMDAPIQGTWSREPAAPRLERAFLPGAYQDRDNFIRDLVTVGYGWPGWWSGTGGLTGGGVPPVTPTLSAADREPVLTLAQCKLHLRIEPEEETEDSYVTDLEMAARLHAENYLRYQIDAGVGENIKRALLFLIAHWYRNREAVTMGTTMTSSPMALAFQSLLFVERDFPIY